MCILCEILVISDTRAANFSGRNELTTVSLVALYFRGRYLQKAGFFIIFMAFYFCYLLKYGITYKSCKTGVMCSASVIPNPEVTVQGFISIE